MVHALEQMCLKQLLVMLFEVQSVMDHFVSGLSARSSAATFAELAGQTIKNS